MRVLGIAGTCISAALLTACNAASSTRALPYGTAAFVKPSAVRQLEIASNSCCVLAVDHLLNRIYVSRTADPAGSNTTVVDGASLSVVTAIAGYGGAHNVDRKTHNFWLPGLYTGTVNVYAGQTDATVATVTLSACPTDSWIDTTRRHAWISAQCGAGNDPVWAVNADTYKRISRRIGTGGVMGVTVVNGATGRFYVNNTSGNYVIDPVSFTKTPTSFGVAYAANARINLVYAVPSSGGLNIVNGNTEHVVTNVVLSYAPNAIAVNPMLDHIYLADGSNFIDVRDAKTGSPIKTITMSSGLSVISLAVDRLRDRIYAGVASSGNTYLYQLKD